MENGPTEELRYGFATTDLGEMLVARSERGIAAVLLGDKRTDLVRQLAQTFPALGRIEDQVGVAGAAAAIASLVAEPRTDTKLPLDLRGSVVEIAVWTALRAIPLGETRSYGAIAKTLPVPATAQEVGAACAANRIALLVPCHRVVKADGSISGYRWGVQRKRRLINREACA
jgi:AraC family transcriptional regulator of adaptative response/methylated-DNA-[protein]-cysteine methyltransferase